VRFGTPFNRAKIDTGMENRDLHFHDLRGTAATRFYIAGLSVRIIAEVMGWEEEYVEKSSAATSAATQRQRAIEQLNRADGSKDEQNLQNH
jgi:integrase